MQFIRIYFLGRMEFYAGWTNDLLKLITPVLHQWPLWSLLHALDLAFPISFPARMGKGKLRSSGNSHKAQIRAICKEASAGDGDVCALCGVEMEPGRECSKHFVFIWVVKGLQAKPEHLVFDLKEQTWKYSDLYLAYCCLPFLSKCSCWEPPSHDQLPVLAR